MNNEQIMYRGQNNKIPNFDKFTEFSRLLSNAKWCAKQRVKGYGFGKPYVFVVKAHFKKDIKDYYYLFNYRKFEVIKIIKLS